MFLLPLIGIKDLPFHIRDRVPDIFSLFIGKVFRYQQSLTRPGIISDGLPPMMPIITLDPKQAVSESQRPKNGRDSSLHWLVTSDGC